MKKWPLFGICLGCIWGVLATALPADAVEPSLTGKRKFAISLESEAYSRDVESGVREDRLRITRQGFRGTYGVHDKVDLFFNVGVGRIFFEDGDLNGKTRPYIGTGLRVVGSTPKGYFGGLSYKLLSGKTQKFQFQDQVLTIKDKWQEQDITAFTGTKDLVRSPVQSGRIYAGIRFTSRADDLTFEDGTSEKVNEDSALGGYLGFYFSDAEVFEARVELGTGDRNSVFASLGLVF